MNEEREPRTHRRRRRRPAAPVPGPQAAPGGASAEKGAADRPRRSSAPRDVGERGLRDIVGAGRSQLGTEGALRGRDVNRPTDEDLAEAEEEVVLVRRHWTPPANS